MEVRKEVVGLALIYIYAGEPDILSLVDVWPALNKHIGHYGDIDTITMSLSLELYKFSDRLMMPELRQNTAKIIIDSVKSIGDAAVCEQEESYETRYAFALDKIYASTEKDDKLVRLPVAYNCLDGLPAILDMESVNHVMKKHEPTLWEIFTESPGNVPAAVEELRGANQSPRLPKRRRREYNSSPDDTSGHSSCRG